MSTEMKSTDQIRKLTNSVHLAGALAELSEINRGVTKDKKTPYISFRGAVQCGPDKSYTTKFRVFVKSLKKDGKPSKAYDTIDKWVNTAVPMTKNPSNPTMVDMLGSVTDNIYVGKTGQLVEGRDFSIQLIGDFKDYAADIDLEGFVYSITDETVEEEETGRKKIRLICRDIFGNTLDVNDIVVPGSLAGELDRNGYERGVTSLFYLSLKPSETQHKSSGGIGAVREVESYSKLEWVLVGAKPPLSMDDEEALDPSVMKLAMNERVAKIDSVKEQGYLGKKEESTFNRNGLGILDDSDVIVQTVTKSSADDDFPF